MESHDIVKEYNLHSITFAHTSGGMTSRVSEYTSLLIIIVVVVLRKPRAIHCIAFGGTHEYT